MHHGKSLPILLRPPPTSTCINERARTHTPSPTLPERGKKKKDLRPVCFTTLAADAAVEGDLCTTAVREAGCSCSSNFFPPPVDLPWPCALWNPEFVPPTKFDICSPLSSTHLAFQACCLSRDSSSHLYASLGCGATCRKLLGVWWAESLPSARHSLRAHSQCGWWLKCVN